jgi:hypothetical protein
MLKYQWQKSLIVLIACMAYACDSTDTSNNENGGTPAGTPAGSEGGTPAGSEGGTPAGSEGGTPAGSEGGTPAGSEGGTTPTEPNGSCEAPFELTAEGSVFSYSGMVEGDDFIGSCSTEGNEANDTVVRFVAPEAGTWKFSTKDSDGFDSVVYVRSVCADEQSELNCNDDFGDANAGEVQSFLSVELEANEEVFVVVDSYQNSEDFDGSFTLTVEMANGTAPVLSTLNAVLTSENVLGLKVSGTDLEENVNGFEVEIFEGDVSLGAYSGAFSDLSFDGLGNFNAYVSAGLDLTTEMPTKVSVAVMDSEGFYSEVLEANLEMPSTLTANAACSAEDVFEVCPANTACMDRENTGNTTCQSATAPAITATTAFYNAMNPALAIEVVGTDAENDVQFFSVTFLDAQGTEIAVSQDFLGNPVTQIDLAFDLVQANGDYTAKFSTPWPAELAVPASVKLVAVDMASLTSAESTATFGMTPMIQAGDACDYARGFNQCPVDYFCIGADIYQPENQAVCAMVKKPVVLSVSHYWNQESAEIALYVDGTDEDLNVYYAKVQGYDANNQAVLAQIEGSFRSIRQADGTFNAFFEFFGEQLSSDFCNGSFDTAFDACTDEDFGVCLEQAQAAFNMCQIDQKAVVNTIVKFEVIVVDATESSSDPVYSTAGMTGDLAGGEMCAINGTAGACSESGMICYTTDAKTQVSMCQTPVAECPATYGTVQTFTQVAGLWTYSGTNENGTVDSFGSCSDNILPVDILSFTATEAGTYVVTVTEAEFDTVVFARKYCGIDVASAELACNDDTNEGLSEITLTLGANETAYIFVQGYDENAVGTYTLSVTKN